MIARVIPLVRLPLQLGEFDYDIPNHLLPTLSQGHIVRIPFRSRHILGIVTAIQSPKEKNHTRSLKQIYSSIYSTPLISAHQLKLIDWFSHYYCVSPTLPALLCTPSLFKKTAPIPTPPRTQTTIEIQSMPSCLTVMNEELKNETFLNVIAANIKQKKQTLLICPMIHDVYRCASYLKKRHADTIALVTSSLSKSTLFNTYCEIMSGEKKIIIGTKRALFYHIPLLETIILDRSERREYKQYDSNPRYDGREVAKKISLDKNIQCIFSSHAPRLEDWVSFQKPTPLPKESFLPSIISLKDEWTQGNSGLISEKLNNAIQETLQKKKNCFLLLNKKGFGSSVICKTCTNVFECTTCHSLQNYSKRTNLLSCVSCKTDQELPKFCPHCHGVNFQFKGFGIEKIHTELKEKFPTTPLYEITKDSLDKNTDTALLSSQGALFLGTTYLPTEYPDFFKTVGLVSLLLCQHTASKTDFRSTEYQFQEYSYLRYLAQSYSSKMIIQTVSPENQFVQDLSKNSLETFYEHLLIQRKKFEWPPDSMLIKLFPKNKKTDMKSVAKIFNKTFSCSFFDGEESKTKSTLLIKIPYDSNFQKLFDTFFSLYQPLSANLLVDIHPITF